MLVNIVIVIARRLATAALWVRIQTSLKNQKRAIYYISIRAANTLQPGKKIAIWLSFGLLHQGLCNQYIRTCLCRATSALRSREYQVKYGRRESSGRFVSPNTHRIKGVGECVSRGWEESGKQDFFALKEFQLWSCVSNL
jgi:hypothetical protein